MTSPKPSLDARLQEMLDHHEIRKVLDLYCHGCDRLDDVQVAGVYSADSWDDHGYIKAPGAEFAKAAIASLAEISTSCSHLLGQSLIKVTGDEAGAETYFLAVTTSLEITGDQSLNLMGGRFVDRLRREDEDWKIVRRTCVRDWSATYPITADWLAGFDHVGGQRSGEDASYAVLGMLHSKSSSIGAPGQ